MILKSSARDVKSHRAQSGARLDAADHRRVPIVQLNQHLTCSECGGYFIDATTIVKCLHTFCRSCIVKHLKSNKYCPVCDVQVHENDPLQNIRPDKTLQDIVYKLVPRLYQDEMQRRRHYYSEHPEAKQSTHETRSAAAHQHILTADETVSVSFNYHGDMAHGRFLRCPAAVTVAHLQKLIRAKHDLESHYRVDVLHGQDPLDSSLTMMDIAYIYLWRRKGPLELTYKIYENISKRPKLDISNSSAAIITTAANVPLDCQQQLPNHPPTTSISSNITNNNNNINDWKEVQLQISENGEMCVTGIQDCLALLDAHCSAMELEVEVKKEPPDKGGVGQVQPPPLKLLNDVNVVSKICDSVSSSVSPIKQKEVSVCGGAFTTAAGDTASSTVVSLNTPVVSAILKNDSVSNTSDLSITVNAVKDTCALAITSSSIPNEVINSFETNSKLNGSESKTVDARNGAVTSVNSSTFPVNGLNAVDNMKKTNTSVASTSAGDINLNCMLPSKSSKSEKESIIKTSMDTCSQSVMETIITTVPETTANDTSKKSLPCTSKKEENCAVKGADQDKALIESIKDKTTTQKSRNKISVLDINVVVPPTISTAATTVTILNGSSSLVSSVAALGLPSTSQLPKSSGGSVAISATLITSSSSASVLTTSSSKLNNTRQDGKRKLDEACSVDQPPCKKPTVLNHSLGLQNLSNNHPLKKHSQQQILNKDAPDKCSKPEIINKMDTVSATFTRPTASFVNRNFIANNRAGTPITKWVPPPTPPCYVPKPTYNPVLNVPKVQPSISAVNKPLEISTTQSAIHNNNKLSVTNKSIKNSTPMGYKTLRDPPKSWNPQIARQVQKGSDVKNVRPAKFFKMRNNMPRYLGNPASGVKPMYQVQTSPEKEKMKAEKTEIKKHSIVKIDPKTLKPVSERAPEISSLSNQSDLKINTSSVPIFNPLKLQSSSPKNDRGPKSPCSPKKSVSPPTRSNKPNLSYTPPNPFIPNLASPTMNPNQLFYPTAPPGFPTYDPRVMAAYHNYLYAPFNQNALNSLKLDLNARKTSPTVSQQPLDSPCPNSPTHTTTKASVPAKNQITKKGKDSKSEKSLQNTVEKLTQNKIKAQQEEAKASSETTVPVPTADEAKKPVPEPTAVKSDTKVTKNVDKVVSSNNNFSDAADKSVTITTTESVN